MDYSNWKYKIDTFTQSKIGKTFYFKRYCAKIVEYLAIFIPVLEGKNQHESIMNNTELSLYGDFNNNVVVINNEKVSEYCKNNKELSPASNGNLGFVLKIKELIESNCVEFISEELLKKIEETK